MSDWNVAIAELKDLVRETVREELTPTGVYPGVYNSVTVDELGRVRFGTAVTSGGASLVAVAVTTTNFGNTLADGAEAVMNFSSVVYDSGSAITTGATWRYTAPATGWYAVDVAAVVRSATGAGTAFYGGAWDTYVNVRSTGGTNYPTTAMDFNGLDKTSTRPELYLRGRVYCYVSAGGTIAAYIGQGNPAGATVQYTAESIAITQY